MHAKVKEGGWLARCLVHKEVPDLAHCPKEDGLSVATQMYLKSRGGIAKMFCVQRSYRLRALPKDRWPVNSNAHTEQVYWLTCKGVLFGKRYATSRAAQGKAVG